jgi:hypothetical protein
MPAVTAAPGGSAAVFYSLVGPNPPRAGGEVVRERATASPR